LSKRCWKNLLLISLSLVGWTGTFGQAANPPSQALPKGSRLRMVVILSRHGVRPPTWTQARLDSYSARPWPKWSVPPGNLTPRGYQLLSRFGGYDRASLAAAGLFAADGCGAAESAYLWADTDQRTVASGHALAEGMFPGCSVEVHGLGEGAGNDPLFHPAAAGVKPAVAEAVSTELAARLKQSLDPAHVALIEDIRNLLLGCALGVACHPTAMPAATLPAAPVGLVPSKAGHLAELDGALPLSSTFAEDLLLEYADGMPMSDVGWGQVDEALLGKLLVLHTDGFELLHRTPAIARAEASNMLFHIAHTLQQGIEGKTVAGAVGPAESKAVLLLGHDTSLAALAALLGVHWQLDGRSDDTPPGTQMAFELWQNAAGAYFVRVTVAMQTMQQLRELSSLTVASPPAHQTLELPACRVAACPWQEFQRIADTAIDTNAVFAMSGK
jgi:4-phytase / acid phosphatase